ncbi:MAG: YeeE/YedE family protein, partial [Rhodobacteraceae bacterium]|nr:YeeE/YedE family protein [Paracoccaceae bacterium]
WAGMGALPVVTAQGGLGVGGGLAAPLAALAAVAVVVGLRAMPGKRLPPRHLWIAAGLLALLALGNLVVAGQPWGIVYGLGLWGAKVAPAGGAALASNAFWAAPANAERLSESLLTDVTTLTNVGLLVGAWAVMRWRAMPGAQVAWLAPSGWAAVMVAGLVLGYSARMAFGCNVGAFFSGISTGSLHGWVWFAAAFAGSALGIRLRPLLLRPAPARGGMAEGRA